MSELLLPLPSLSPTGCGGGATGILTRGHDNVLINCLGTSEGKEDYVGGSRSSTQSISLSRCERTIGYRPCVVLRARPSVRRLFYPQALPNMAMVLEAKL